MFQRVLIANRGEIAVRIAKSLRRLGIASVAVHSDVESNALHVRCADQSVEIGEAHAARSYLDGQRIIEAALATGAEAVHPGYGFLSENADFAAAVRAAGLVFVGPSERTIRMMGDKSNARGVAMECGIMAVPGHDVPSDGRAERVVDAVGLPLMLKATAGGGGRGMRKVRAASELERAITSAEREAHSAFGDGRLYAERLIERARHIEVQVLGDARGRVAVLGERDCSVQRRHQKVVEESPCAAVSDSVREELFDAARKLAGRARYENAGTIEFLHDPSSHEVFFLEMNTRLQVEHGVTELVLGLDLVELQLRIAAGEHLDDELLERKPSGHAMEFRVCAEDPTRGYLPSPGTVTCFEVPDGDVRLDAGVAAGDVVTPYYDSLLAKLLVRGGDRSEALARAKAALDGLRIEGVATNLPQLRAVVAHEDFVSNNLHVSWLEDVWTSRST